MRSPVPCPAAARALLRDDRLVVLATETIGAQLSAVALLDRHGHVLLATAIRPIRPIPALADAPPLEQVWPTLAALLASRIVGSRQIAADRCVLRSAARRLGATLMYAEWQGVGALSRSCGRAAPGRQCPCSIPSAGAALTDARVTLAGLRALAGPPTQVPPSRRLFWRYIQ